MMTDYHFNMDEKQIYQDLLLASANVKSSLLYLTIKTSQMRKKYGDNDVVKEFQQVVDNLESFSRAWDKQTLEIKVLNIANNKRKQQITSLNMELQHKNEMIERLKKGI